MSYILNSSYHFVDAFRSTDCGGFSVHYAGLKFTLTWLNNDHTILPSIRNSHTSYVITSTSFFFWYLKWCDSRSLTTFGNMRSHGGVSEKQFISGRSKKMHLDRFSQSNPSCGWLNPAIFGSWHFPYLDRDESRLYF